MENRPEYVGIWLGLSKAGLVGALVNTNLRHEVLLHSVNIVSCKAIIFGSSLKDGKTGFDSASPISAHDSKAEQRNLRACEAYVFVVNLQTVDR